MQLTYMILSFFIYGFLGWCVEVAFAAWKEGRFVNRGFLNGPICPIYGVGVVAVVEILRPFADNLFLLYILSAVLVTMLEWLTGFVLEKIFHHKWWDYSGMPLNLNGYVCLLFSLIWGVGCVLIVKVLHPLIYQGICFLPLWAGNLLDVLLGVALAADISVTSSAIMKFNRRLEKMEELAAELHRISEHLGEGIYKNIMEGMERQEQYKEKADELRRHYEELLKHNVRAGRRIIRAFPRISTEKYKEELRKLKERILH